MCDQGGKRVLILAYYFPPLGMGGVQRSAKFVKYLPSFGWQPVVVTVKETAYFAKDDSLAGEVAQARVERTGSLDPQRLLYLVKGRRRTLAGGDRAGVGTLWRRYETLTSWLFVPDAKLLWVPFALCSAWRLLARERVQVVMTTSPPPSAHLVGLVLRRLRRCRWVADFRDQWTGGHLDRAPTRVHRAVNRCLERLVLGTADRVVCVSQRLAASLATKSHRRDFQCVVIPNGYDEEDFSPVPRIRREEKLLVYCGSLSRFADPRNYLKACATLIRRGGPSLSGVRLVFVGETIGVDLQGLFCELGLQEVAKMTGYVAHSEAVRWLQSADVLVLLLTGTSAQDVVPGKVFEYLRAGKPILAVVPPGETADLLRKYAPHAEVCEDTPEAIERCLRKILSRPSQVRGGANRGLEQFERRHLTARLAQVLDSLCTGREVTGLRV